MNPPDARSRQCLATIDQVSIDLDAFGGLDDSDTGSLLRAHTPGRSHSCWTRKTRERLEQYSATTRLFSGGSHTFAGWNWHRDAGSGRSVLE